MGRITHGETRKTREYRAWEAMKGRCAPRNRKNTRNWGQLGILVCVRWKNSYPMFLQDMGRAPSSRHTLERTNVYGNYEPGNVVWATWTEQARNRRNTQWITIQGRRMALAELAVVLKMPWSTLKLRLQTVGLLT